MSRTHQMPFCNCPRSMISPKPFLPHVLSPPPCFAYQVSFTDLGRFPCFLFSFLHHRKCLLHSPENFHSGVTGCYITCHLLLHSGVFWEYPDALQSLSPTSLRDRRSQWDPEGLREALGPTMISLETQVSVK